MPGRSFTKRSDFPNSRADSGTNLRTAPFQQTVAEIAVGYIRLHVVHTNRDAVDERERLRVFSEHGCEVSWERRIRAFGFRPDPRLTTWFSTRGSVKFLSH